ncbi:cyclic pyranopterin monophosphate synthase MoaC [Desulfomicrobium orale]|uniref:Cyclic pyranopterin monophosphate synthase n=1 Tax=Desulfomicrobium orale DSM 12838 TaxID=888061 RepID=A0A109W6J5_9BACT|nr:cyclic pyranopterin monophosphate synthase MoaC [Desulfomicrobium orale]AMD93796.1 cyclic pyranopterin monophosphate synthase accessory protein [Desulfomicrobium orale DSM 12838]
MAEQKLTHVDASGEVTMVDVGDKAETRRRAVVRTRVLLGAETFALLRDSALPKGDVLTTAKIAGIMAAKRTWELIPMCHPLFLSKVDVRLTPVPADLSIEIEAEARTTGPTGVEMEALMAAQVAAMTVYDMCKAVQRDIRITDCRLVHKSGGKSGEFNEASGLS